MTPIGLFLFVIAVIATPFVIAIAIIVFTLPELLIAWWIASGPENRAEGCARK